VSFLDRPQSVWWRKVLFQIHLWTGVAIGLYVIAVCLSGVVLVMANDQPSDIPTAPNPPGDNTLLSIQTLVRHAQSAHPGELVESIDGRWQNRGTLVLYIGNRLMYMDIHRGEIVADVIPSHVHPYVSFFRTLHVELLGGPKGERLSGAGALLLFAMCSTGIVLWWPGRKSWKQALSVRWRASWPRLNWDLHTALGFWALALIAMWAITGAYFIFPQPFRQAIRFFSTVPDVPRASGWNPGQDILNLDQFVVKARQLYPRSQLSFLTLAVQQPNGYIDVLLSPNPAIPTTILRDEVFFNPATGQVLGSDSSSQWTIGYVLCYWVFSLHLGDFAGLTSKVLWTILGLAPVCLVITGYLMWWNRVLRKKLAALRKRSVEKPTSTVSLIRNAASVDQNI